MLILRRIFVIALMLLSPNVASCIFVRRGKTHLRYLSVSQLCDNPLTVQDGDYCYKLQQACGFTSMDCGGTSYCGPGEPDVLQHGMTCFFSAAPVSSPAPPFPPSTTPGACPPCNDKADQWTSGGESARASCSEWAINSSWGATSGNKTVDQSCADWGNAECSYTCCLALGGKVDTLVFDQDPEDKPSECCSEWASNGVWGALAGGKTLEQSCADYDGCAATCCEDLGPGPGPSPTPTPTPGSQFMGAGWCQGAYGNTCTWNDKGSVLLPGGFQSDPSIPPSKSNWGDVYTNVWLTIGGLFVGDKTQVGTCLDVDAQINVAEDIGANGFNFDMEGCLTPKGQPNILNMIKTFIAGVNAKSPGKYVFVYVPQGGLSEATQYDASIGFTYVAPMQYGGAQTYQQLEWSQTKLDGYIQKWVDAGWQKSMTFITYESESAAADGGAAVLIHLCNMTKSKGYVGLLGWPGSKEQNTANQAILSTNGC